MSALHVRWCAIALASMLALATACSKKSAGGAASGADTAAGSGACGEKGQPDCPLQGWMTKNLQDAMDANNLTLVANNLPKVSAFVPDPTWNTSANSWSSLVQKAASAAETGDADSTREACKTCHRAWRKQYRDEFRKRPLPN